MPDPLIGPDALVLGIETSCDETAIGVVRGGREMLSNVIASQVALHAPFGGVVPEIAARAHDEHLSGVLDKALRDAGVKATELHAVTATRGPGLIGALLVGFAAGKIMASALDLPFCGVHHLEGHVFANVLEFGEIELPYVALIVSGGHTSLMSVREPGVYTPLGATLDDAAGEAFDKIARFLDLGYPGGPAIDRLARKGDATVVDFPRAMLHKGLDFSFSGLKTAVVRHVQRAEREGHVISKPDIAASFQEAVVDVQLVKSMRACELEQCKTLVLGGGVAANTRLRARLAEECEKRGIRLLVPDRKLCVDNGAMIAAAGHFRLMQGETTAMDTSALASWSLPDGVSV